MQTDNRGQLSFWIGGILLALLLIFVSRGGLGIGNQALQQRFALQATAATGEPPISLPQLDIDLLAPEARDAARRLQEQIGLGQPVPGLTPVAQSSRLRVEVREVRRVASGVQVRGEVTNIGAAAVQVPISAFELRDSAGATYVAGGGIQARLTPGASTPLDLTAPVPAGRGLALRIIFPPDPMVEQVLLLGENE